MKKRLGLFNLGCHGVRVITDNTRDGGSFTCAATDGMAEITIGLMQRTWSECLTVLLHEALEMSWAVMGVRFRPMPDYAGDNGAYVFHMSHTQFSEGTGQAAFFVAACVPELSTAWNAWDKKYKQTKKQLERNKAKKSKKSKPRRVGISNGVSRVEFAKKSKKIKSRRVRK